MSRLWALCLVLFSGGVGQMGPPPIYSCTDCAALSGLGNYNFKTVTVTQTKSGHGGWEWGYGKLYFQTDDGTEYYFYCTFEWYMRPTQNGPTLVGRVNEDAMLVHAASGQGSVLHDNSGYPMPQFNSPYRFQAARVLMCLMQRAEMQGYQWGTGEKQFWSTMLYYFQFYPLHVNAHGGDWAQDIVGLRVGGGTFAQMRTEATGLLVGDNGQPSLSMKAYDLDGDGAGASDPCPRDCQDGCTPCGEGNDCDGDGICNADDPTPGCEVTPDDCDGDGIPNAQDPTPGCDPDDCDGDGIPNEQDPEPGDCEPYNPDDCDGDGIPNAEDPTPGCEPQPGDCDGDGIPDAEDSDECPVDPNDCDGDGIPNAEDPTPGECPEETPCEITQDDCDGDCIPNTEDPEPGECGSDDEDPEDPEEPCEGCGDCVEAFEQRFTAFKLKLLNLMISSRLVQWSASDLCAEIPFWFDAGEPVYFSICVYPDTSTPWGAKVDQMRIAFRSLVGVYLGWLFISKCWRLFLL